MRKLFVAAATVAIFALLVTPAFAAPGGNGGGGNGGGGGGSVTGTIELDVPVGFSTTAEVSMSYGGSAHFRTTVEGKIGSKAYVYVTVVCVQGKTVVYQWSADPGFTFPLVDQAGQGLEWSGGDADCTAALVYRDEAGRTPTVIFLDQTTFHVTAE
jgi:hypothetical protein